VDVKIANVRAVVIKQHRGETRGTVMKTATVAITKEEKYVLRKRKL